MSKKKLQKKETQNSQENKTAHVQMASNNRRITIVPVISGHYLKLDTSTFMARKA